MDAAVVIPTIDARDLLERALESLGRQTAPARQTIVVDNASADGTAEMVARRFPHVTLVRNAENLGFGRAVNRGAAAADADALVLVNNDVLCRPGFLEALLAPLADPGVGMVAGVLTQMRAPGRIDSAGVALDVTLGSSDHLADRTLEALDGAPAPAGPCGGAAAYRMDAFRAAGGFDETLFAYWEDVDLALRLARAGWRCALAPDALAEHHHGATLGGASARQRRLDAFGRGYVLAKHGAARGRPLRAAQVAVRDWPALAVHLLVRREAGPIVERARAVRAGRRNRLPAGPPPDVPTHGLGPTLLGQAGFLARRITGRLPAHYADRGPAAGGPG